MADCKSQNTTQLSNAFTSLVLHKTIFDMTHRRNGRNKITIWLFADKSIVFGVTFG
jgi:hypothetical protein